ncbi:non-ribosomal peptide synthetase [Streptomyces sp. NPDC059781]|uniref:non-ribosomal peptide synthetase n=1 Tax=unclassified Streptomyces TaxID=2593676 RepID=UPI003665B493
MNHRSNPLAADRPERRTVQRLMEQLARRAPHEPAVECGKERLTFGELWDRSAEVAASVRDMAGHAPGGIVATLFTRGIPGVVAQLGIWRAECAYLPLDPSLPDDRIRTVLSGAGQLGVVAEPEQRRRIPDPDGTGVSTPASPSPYGGAGDAGRAGGAAAYVIYTSGSTGTPKGVAVGHHSLVNLIDWHHRTYGTGPGVRVGAVAGLGFDASVWEVWSTLANGATLVLPEIGVDTADITAIAGYIEACAIEQCFLSTPLAEQFFALDGIPGSLRIMTTGGDRLRLHPPADFPVAVFNHYGPTESTVVTTAGNDLRHAPRTGLPAIGRPITNATVRLTDPAGRVVVAPGEEGELWVGGEVLALGYHRDEALTAERFVRGADGSTWYRTGDLCRWDEAGELEFVERRDGQVSLRGYRVELAEVEQTALDVPGVEQAAATVLPGPDGDPALLLFHCGTAREDGVRAALARRLPAYMVPNAIHHVERIPLNTNGKIDRGALPAALLTAPPADTPMTGGTTLERMADIWAQYLGHRPDARDDFFTIGGHSIRAARVTAEVRKQFAVNIGLTVLFGNPVLADYASRVDELVREGA